ncbi:MAG: KGG domain-containing protein [Polyangiales bacterium]
MPRSGNRGFAAMDPEKQREIARKGGKAAHQKGTAHQFSSDEAREAGRKGGEAVSKNRDHMAEIGRQGGEAVSKDRQHMSRIGREGGEARATSATKKARPPESGTHQSVPPSNDGETKEDEPAPRRRSEG